MTFGETNFIEKKKRFFQRQISRDDLMLEKVGKCLKSTARVWSLAGWELVSTFCNLSEAHTFWRKTSSFFPHSSAVLEAWWWRAGLLGFTVTWHCVERRDLNSATSEGPRQTLHAVKTDDGGLRAAA